MAVENVSPWAVVPRTRALEVVRHRATLAAVAAAAGAVAVLGTIGGDSRWLAALGADIAATGHIPHGVPFATASTGSWHNPLVLAQLLFHALWSAGGDRALLAAQLVAVAAGFSLLAADARRAGGSDASVAAALAVVLVGGISAIAVVRLQLFSLALFPLLLALLRSDRRAPSRRIALLWPLIAVWANLHGAVLTGILVALVYLLVDRARRAGAASALVLAAGTLLAPLCTPALLHTPAYFWSVLHNYTAVHGYGLWAPLSIHSGFDVVLGLGILLLGAAALRGRPAAWELAAAGALTAATVHTARTGIWLLFLLVAPAATAIRFRRGPGPRTVFAVAGASVVACLFGLVAPSAGRGEDVVAQAVQMAHGRPILADGELGELVAVDGGRVWVGNPIDAFGLGDQATFISWLRGEPAGDAAYDHAGLIVVSEGSAAYRRLLGLRIARLVFSSGGVELYELIRRTATTASR